MSLLLLVTASLGFYAAYNNLAYNAFLMGIFSGKIATHIILKVNTLRLEKKNG